ncbi:ATP-binding response regulator [Gemmatimonas sp.]
MKPLVRARTVRWYLLLYVAASLLSLIVPRVVALLPLAFAPMGLLAIVTTWLAGNASSAPRERRAWQLLAVGEAAFWVGGQIWTWSVAHHRPFPLDAAFDVLSAALVVSGLLCFPAARRAWWRDRRAVLDGLLLSVAIGALIWLFLLQPMQQMAPAEARSFLINILVTAPELVVLGWAYLRAGAQPLRSSLGLWLGAALLSASADFLWDALSTRYLPGSWVDTPWFLAWALRWYAAHLVLVRTRPGVVTTTGGVEADRDDPASSQNEARGITPAAIAAATYVSLVIAAVLGRTDNVRFLGFASVTMTILLLLRQRSELGYTQKLSAQAASQARRFRALLAQATDYVFVLDAQQRVAFIGPAVERAQLAAVGADFVAMFDISEHDAIRAWFEQPVHEAPPLRCRLRTSPESTLELRKQDRRNDAHIRGWVVVARDRSMELALEQRVRHSEKLAALHDMAGRVAHAYNNLLSSVIGRADLLAEALPPSSPWLDDVASIHSAAARGAAITRQLLGFSDAHATRLAVVNGATAIAELVPVLERLMPSNISLDLSRVEPAILVRVEVSQFEQVITNLVTNARDAMAGGGVVSVSWTAEDGAAKLEVADTGCGMSPEVQKRVFDPFFTTKPIGKGTGLGLAMVAAMVQRAGGQVAIHSTPEVGTRVMVRLPLVAGELPTTADRLATVVSAQSAAASRTILLVDDDREVRQVSARILRRAGYQVMEAENGTQALAMLADASVVLDLLLTDMMMPGISGAELVTLTRGLRATLPIICVTGFVAVGDGSDGWQRSVDAVVEKPFSAAGLTAAVQAVLATRT